MHVFKHPKYYTELRKRNRVARNPMGGYSQSDQAISHGASTEANSRRAPDPGPKPQAASSKPQAASVKHQACEASSGKHQAPSKEVQAPSRKLQAP